MKKIKINFVDFWPDLNNENNFFLQLLSKHYEVEIHDDPDILFYSKFGFEHLKYKCKKVFYTGENIKPDFKECDYSFSFEETDKRNFCFPHFVEYNGFFELMNGHFNLEHSTMREKEKTEFCSFMASNFGATERIQFVEKLMQYKKVDCSGPVLYNMETKNVPGKEIENRVYKDWRREKLDIIHNYKFTIAFENEQSQNYVTEKIFQPLLVKSIPIYWGASNIDEYFNPKAFINVSKFESFDDAIKEIVKIDQNPALYNEYITQPPILKDSKISNITIENILDRLEMIIGDNEITVGKKFFLSNQLKYYFHKFKHAIRIIMNRVR